MISGEFPEIMAKKFPRRHPSIESVLQRQFGWPSKNVSTYEKYFYLRISKDPIAMVNFAIRIDSDINFSLAAAMNLEISWTYDTTTVTSRSRLATT